MKVFSFIKRLKNHSVMDRIWELRREKLSNNERKQKKLIDRYYLWQIFNQHNINDTVCFQCYYRLKKKYQYVLDEELLIKGVSEKSDKIWICWFQGEENAPDIVKACIRSIRKQLLDKEIIVLTDKNIPEYLDIPEYITEKVGKAITLTHYSDIIRVMLLNRYGGLWVDATTFCSSREFADFFCTIPLFVYQNVDMMRRDAIPIVAESWLIYSETNQRILLLVERLLLEYWKNETELIHYFLFHIFFTLATEKYPDDWKAVPVFSEVPPNVMGFELSDKFDQSRWSQFLRMSDFHKLSYKWPHGDENDEQTLYNHILRENLE